MVRSKEKKEKDRHNHHCSVQGCPSLTGRDSLKFFRVIRSDDSLTERWVQAIERADENGTDWKPTQNSRICGRHFHGG